MASAAIGAMRVLLSMDTAEFESGTKRAKAEQKELEKAFEGLGRKIGAAFSVGAIIAWGKEAVDAAGKIGDLAAKTGLSTDAVQKFGYAAEQSGSTVETMARAVFQLGTNVAKGGTSITTALDALGLSLQDVRSLKPEEQFDLIARKLGDVANITDRNSIGVALMGRAYSDIAPAITDYAELVGKAHVATADSIEAIKAADDALKSFTDGAQKTTIRILGDTVIGFKGFSLAARDAWATLTGGLEGHRQFIEQLRQEKDAKAAVKEATEKLSRETAGALEASKREAEEHKKAEQAAAAHARAINTLVRAWNGADLEAKAKDLTEAFGKLTKAEKANADIMARVAEDANDLERKGVKLTGALHTLAIHHEGVARGAELQDKITRDLAITTGKYAITAEQLVKRTDAAVHSLSEFVVAGGDAAFRLTDTANVISGLVAPAISQWEKLQPAIEGIIDGVSASVSYGLTSMIGHWSHHASILKEIWQGIKNSFLNVLDQMLNSFINSFLKGMLNAIGAARLGESLANSLLSGLGVGGGVPGGGLINAGVGLLTGGGVAGALTTAEVGGAIAANAPAGALIGGGTGAGAGAGIGAALGTAAVWGGGIAAPLIIGRLINPGPGYQPYLSPDQVREAYAEYFGEGYESLLPEDMLTVSRGDVPWWQGNPAGSGAEPDMSTIRNLGEGGIVMPRVGGTIVRLAEAGIPEAVIPLDYSGSGAGTARPVILKIGEREIARAIVPLIPAEVRRLQLAR